MNEDIRVAEIQASLILAYEVWAGLACKAVVWAIPSMARLV